MLKLLLATRNLHKLEEIRTILGNNFQCLSLIEFPDAPEIEEDAATFEGNAIKKAEGLANWLQSLPNQAAYVLADDSGLEVDALGGAPGVHSARFAALDKGVGVNSTDADNNAKLLRLLKDLPIEKRTGRFRCVIVLLPMNRKSEIRNPQCFTGVCEGRISHKPSGERGFGYDPLFFPEGFDQSFAELGEKIKNRISHRSIALQKLKSELVQHS